MLRKAITILLLAVVGILVQGTLIKALFPGAISPSLLLIMVVFLAFYEGNFWGLATAFCLGLLLDMCSGLLLGPWSGAFVLVFAGVSSLSQRIFVESPVAVMITTFLSSLFSNLVYFLIVLQVRRSGFVFSWSLALEALFTAILCVPLFPFLRWILVAAPSVSSRRVGVHA